MRYLYHDKKYKFKYLFDSENGTYIRTGILDEKGQDTGVDPFMGSFPHLIDVGIMGHCLHGKTGLCVKAGIGCYQSGLLIEEPNMTLEDFESLAKQCQGKVNQFALGGRGDPDQHEYFEEILQLCRDHQIVPNFTTSGYGMTPEIAKLCAQYCGAVAVSWYRSPYTLKAIDMLVEAGVTTNIHYVLGNNSIDEAIDRMVRDDFPKGISAVIFLLHKPAGQGTEANVLDFADPRVEAFFQQIDRGKYSFQVGVDSCCVPGLVNHCHNIIPEVIEPCEGGRFSCYISADMRLFPCSFDQIGKYAVSLREQTIEAAWNSPEFERFRDSFRLSCSDCQKRTNCLGGCPLMPQIVLCGSGNKNLHYGQFLETDEQATMG